MMAEKNTIKNLRELSFQEAITFTADWLETVSAESLSEQTILENLTELLSSRNGVRGFFVAYLTGDSPLADQPPSIFFEAFQQTANDIREILVKNVAMSTAMAIAHERNNNPDQQAGSQQVQRRSQAILRTLEAGSNGNLFLEERQALLTALDTQTGEYENFLQRWKYDAEQRQAMRAALVAIAAE